MTAPSATWPVLDGFRASLSPEGDGLRVEVQTTEGAVLRFGMDHRAVSAVVACLLDVARRAPPGIPPGPAARVAADAVGVALSDAGEALLVFETGGAALSYALPPDALAELARGLRQVGRHTSRLRAPPQVIHPHPRRHGA
ncbi:hypothetical protein C8P66_10143 [Humitalea rosea]|uniref:Uncharacterized protein n=1 Tax=Humitalea rosea TaxID=990373 RepID=A0A2W7KQF9_9PROT|nr:hypothetical protein [Humitalea rosea]PZW50830.1 hypothetical protein C8P66_10143 [Humitalea rosea]